MSNDTNSIANWSYVISNNQSMQSVYLFILLTRVYNFKI